MDRPGKNGGTLRSYEKGQSGNPAGRPAGKSNLISRIIQELGDLTNLELSVDSVQNNRLVKRRQLSYATDGKRATFAAVAIQLLQQALSGDMEAIKVILDRTEGCYSAPKRLTSQASRKIELITYQPGQIIPGQAEAIV